MGRLVAVGLPMRVYLSFESYPPTTERFLDILTELCKSGISTVVVDWERLFPWSLSGMPTGAGLFDEKEVGAVAERAEALGVELVPVFSLFARSTPLLASPARRHLRADGAFRLDGAAPGAAKYAVDLLDDLCALLPRVKTLFLPATGRHSDSVAVDRFVESARRRGVVPVIGRSYRGRGSGSSRGPFAGLPSWRLLEYDQHYMPDRRIAECGDVVLKPPSESLGIEAVVDLLYAFASAADGRGGAREHAAATHEAVAIRNVRRAFEDDLDLAWNLAGAAWSAMIGLVQTSAIRQRAMWEARGAIAGLGPVLARARRAAHGMIDLGRVRRGWIGEYLVRRIGPAEEIRSMVVARLKQAEGVDDATER